VHAARGALESLAVAVSAARLYDDDLRELRAAALPTEPVQDGDYSEMFGSYLGLHEFIRRRSPLEFLSAHIDSVQFHRSRLLDPEHSASGSYRKASLEEHRAIVEAIERRDGKAARELMQ